MSDQLKRSRTCEEACPMWLTRKAVLLNEEKRNDLARAKKVRKALPLLALGERFTIGGEITALKGEIAARDAQTNAVFIEDVTNCRGPLEEKIYGEGELSEDVIAVRRHCGAYLLSRGIDTVDTSFSPVMSE